MWHFMSRRDNCLERWHFVGKLAKLDCVLPIEEESGRTCLFDSRHDGIIPQGGEASSNCDGLSKGCMETHGPLLAGLLKHDQKEGSLRIVEGFKILRNRFQSYLSESRAKLPNLFSEVTISDSLWLLVVENLGRKAIRLFDRFQFDEFARYHGRLRSKEFNGSFGHFKDSLGVAKLGNEGVRPLGGTPWSTVGCSCLSHGNAVGAFGEQLANPCQT
jgi:hypothetical protein